MRFFYHILIIFCIIVSSCTSGTGEKANSKRLVTHALTNPKTLNPQCHSSQIEDQMVHLMFQSLLQLDIHSGKLVPVLAEAVPKRVDLKNGAYKYDFEIRNEAKWDDGEDITAKDVLFSLKLFYNPALKNGIRYSYLEPISHVELDLEKPKRFSIYFDKPYTQSLWCLVDLKIVDKRLWDEKHIYDVWSLESLKEYVKHYETKKDTVLEAYAEVYNSHLFTSDTTKLIGSGPYQLKVWEANQYILFKKKKDWWGDKIKANHYFNAKSNEIQFEIIKDWNLAISALKNGQIDVLNSVPMDDFLKMREDESLKGSLDFQSPSNFIYEYIAFNTRDELFMDKEWRHYIASLIDKEMMVEKVLQGLGSPIYSMIHPSKSYYNKDIALRAQSENLVVKDLKGKEIRILFNAGNKRREKVARMIALAIEKAGGKVTIEQWDWSVYLDKRKQGDFQIIIGAFGGSPAPENLKQTWHTSSILTGRNFAAFGNEYSDALIDSINLEMDEVKRGEMYKRFQMMVYKVRPFVFLYTLSQRIIRKNEFAKSKVSSVRPNYWLGDF